MCCIATLQCHDTAMGWSIKLFKIAEARARHAEPLDLLDFSEACGSMLDLSSTLL